MPDSRPFLPMKIENVCVLGGAGFIGGHLVAQLAASGRRVRVPTRRREAARRLWLLPGVEVVEDDVLAPGALARHIQGMDAVVNLVGILHERRAGDFLRVHAEFALAVAKTCIAHGVPRLLHMSALAADEHAASAYLQSKGRGEASVLNAMHHGLAVTVLRPSVVFGPGDSFLNLFARLLPYAPILPLPAATARLKPVYVGDVARAFSAALDEPNCFGQRYDLCGPHEYTLRELVEYVARLKGLCPLIVPLSRRTSLWYARLMAHLPGKPITPDDVHALLAASACAGPFARIFGFAPTALEAVAPFYLAAG
jgi:NADH dehydrogenase